MATVHTLQGYEGLVAGGDFIKKMEWNDVSMIIHKVRIRLYAVKRLRDWL